MPAGGPGALPASVRTLPGQPGRRSLLPDPGLHGASLEMLSSNLPTKIAPNTLHVHTVALCVSFK